MQLSNERKKELYHQMLRMRKFEQTCEKNFYEGTMKGFLHLGVGEEGVAGVICQLNNDDTVCATHRGHGPTLLKGADMGRMFAELCGRVDGLSKGRGGTMHMGDYSKGILGTNGILGAGAPIATGTALSFKIEHKKNVAVSVFGEGQSNEGGIHEAMNFAAVKKLPVLFVCTNNLYGMWTSWDVVSAVKNVADRAAGYGMPGIVVDGNNVLDVYDVANQAIERARMGGGPTLIELKTYRQTDHAVGLAEPWRTQEERDSWWERDPVKWIRNNLIASGVPEAELDEIDQDVDAEIAKALKFALDSPFPDVSIAAQDVYTDIDVEVDRV